MSIHTRQRPNQSIDDGHKLGLGKGKGALPEMPEELDFPQCPLTEHVMFKRIDSFNGNRRP